MIKKQAKSQRKFWSIVLVVVIAGIAALGIYMGVMWMKVTKEHNEILSMAIEDVDFKTLRDGSYEGYYEGGMYRWRENKIRVVVGNGKVATINVLEHAEGCPAEFTNELFGRVIQRQSLNVDMISGATLTSKAYLKGVENAVLKAQ